MTPTPNVPEDMTELVNASIDRVDLVGAAANGTRFLIAKGAGLVPADAVRDLIEKADKTPDEGDETVPGTAAWEAVDAAAAQQWLSVLVRAKNALCALSDREAAEGGEDWAASMNLSDAADAVAYAVRVLAEFAANEAYEADPPDDVLAVAKAVDQGALTRLEAITPLVKAGRALSAANEKALKDAAQKIQAVLNSLPQPEPENENLLKENPAMAEENTTPQAEAEDITKETAETHAVEANTGSSMKDAVAKLAAGLEAVEKAGEAGADSIDTLREAATDATAEVVKADKPKAKKKLAKAATLTAVYDKNGNLIGVVDPASLTAVDGGGDGDDAPAEGDTVEESAEVNEAAVAGDDAPADGTERTIPGTNTIQAPVQKDGENAPKKKGKKKNRITKSETPTDIAEVLKELLTPFAEEIRKTQDLAGAVKELEERITKYGKLPDDRNSAYLNGATGTPGVAHRDGAEADPYTDLRKAANEARTQADVIKSNKDLAFAQIKDALSGSQHFNAVTERFTP